MGCLRFDFGFSVLELDPELDRLTLDFGREGRDC
jgi:hypothetical protein